MAYGLLNTAKSYACSDWLAREKIEFIIQIRVSQESF